MIKAFLIGAGATKAQYSNAPLSSDFFQIMSEHGGTKNLFRDTEKMARPFLSKPLEKSNIEDVIIHFSSLPQPQRNKLLENVYIAIYRLLATSTQSDSNSMHNYIEMGRHTGSQTLFKTLITDTRFEKTNFFITLNYDLYLDREILGHQRTIDYGIRQGFSGDSHWVVEENRSLSVYHLHGSLNWEFDRNRRIRVDRGAVIPKRDKSGHNICLVPPGRKKLFPHLSHVWEVAEERLLDADELVIIGCSLNLDDKELVTLIKKFVDKKGANKVKIIHTSVNRDSNSFKNYLNIIGKGFKDHPYGFDINGPDENPQMGAIEFIFS